MKELIGKLIIVQGHSLTIGEFSQTGILVDVTPYTLILSHSSNEIKKENRSPINRNDVKNLLVVNSTQKVNHLLAA